MEIPKELNDLIDRFDRNIDEYKSGRYNETQVRREFIDPMFRIMGWDMYNEKGYAEAYKEVIHEDTIKVGGATKAPDYCFRIGGNKKFFLEAKKPHIEISEEHHPAFQLRRYGFSAKLPLSILTDFEEFAVYDCRIRPYKTDKATTQRIFYCTYKEFIEKWNQITSIFSPESIMKGSFDKYVQSNKIKKGTAEVDDAFLNDIENWRKILAKDIALRNGRLSQRELNFSVQKTIDRIIFLRICEDRGIESYGQLLELIEKENIYKKLCGIFHRSDEKYNSGLFHFNKEKEREETHDELTMRIKIDDKVLLEIIRSLYIDSPYEFSVMPADILGQVYEQFLGKIIRLTAGHRAVIEDKPEVKKARGVFYTPTYIVEYIVKNTIGKLLEGLTPKYVSSIKILDPACGSGSFLIEAYQYILDWHRDFYFKDGVDKHTKELYKREGMGWALTTSERKRILLNNIYGVDIDPQAVEVTKLSLLLKVLEGETEQTLKSQLEMFKERALPDLGKNIKCGNSLIGPDFYDNKQLSLLDEEENYRINVFDWEKEYKEIFNKGGFDVVIGNPPWAFTKYVDWGEESKTYIQKHYLLDETTSNEGRARQAGKINLFAIFILKSMRLLKKDGLFGYIIPNNILRTTVYDIIRQHLLKHYILEKIVDLKSGVFEGVTASTIILLMKSKEPDKSTTIEVIDNKQTGKIEESIINRLEQYSCLNNTSFVIDIFLDNNQKKLFDKINSLSVLLGQLVKVSNGVATFKDKEGIFDYKKNNKCKPILFGKDISRYHYEFNNKFVEYIRAKLQRPRNEKIFLAKEKLIMQRIGVFW